MNVLQSFRLDGQVAIVTGASRGLGAAMALALEEAGADVALDARRSGRTQTSIERLGRRAIAINADIDDRQWNCRYVTSPGKRLHKCCLHVAGSRMWKTSATLTVWVRSIDYKEEPWQNTMIGSISLAEHWSPQIWTVRRSISSRS